MNVLSPEALGSLREELTRRARLPEPPHCASCVVHNGTVPIRATLGNGLEIEAFLCDECSDKLQSPVVNWALGADNRVTMPTPSLGRTVHYVLPEETGIKKPGEHRPASIVRVWDQDQGVVNLQVQVDGDNDIDSALFQQTRGLLWKCSVRYDETGTQPNTWHWPERVGL